MELWRVITEEVWVSCLPLLEFMVLMGHCSCGRRVLHGKKVFVIWYWASSGRRGASKLLSWDGASCFSDLRTEGGLRKFSSCCSNRTPSTRQWCYSSFFWGGGCCLSSRDNQNNSLQAYPKSPFLSDSGSCSVDNVTITRALCKWKAGVVSSCFCAEKK